VEGKDDCYSILNLIARHGYDWDSPRAIRPYVDVKFGRDPLLDALPVAVKSSYERIGVVLDADLSPDDRWNQLRRRVPELSLPEVPSPDGVVAPGLRPGTRFGAWLMPDNKRPGCLEDFLARLVPDTDPVWPYTDGATTRARELGAGCGLKDHVKGRVYSWLAWQEEPGLPFGLALRARVFRHDGPEALRFVSWFRTLFVN
jgi:hypothetical protein